MSRSVHVPLEKNGTLGRPALAASAHAHPAAGRALRRKCACGNRAGGGGSCEECAEETALQRKALGSPGAADESRCEAEADRIADQVASQSSASSVAGPGAGPPPAIQRRRNDESGTLDHVPSAVESVLSSPGRPLDAATRQYFEPRLGHDFSRVRVHVDDAAADSVDAQAFTVGHHVVLGASHYRPGNESGRRLLAHELTHVVQQGALDGAPSSRTGVFLARQPKAQGGSGLLPPERVEEVFQAWVAEFMKSRNSTMLTPAIEQEARERTKTQVGPGNFANWERWGEAEFAKIWAQAEADNPKPAEAEAEGEPFDPDAQLIARYDKMWDATKELRAEVVRVEHLAQKLNFGGGAKGTIARITAGGYTATWGIGARTVTSVSEHAPMFVLGGIGLGLGSELAEETLVKEGQAVKREGEEMGEDARTAVRLVGGDLQAAYDATRPSYVRYQTAYSDFTDASVKFKKDLQLSGIEGFSARTTDIANMDAAMEAMRKAGSEFLTACATLGIETDAQALDKMSSHVVEGAQGAVATAVTGPLLEVAPGLGAMKRAFKRAEGMGARQVEKAAADEVASVITKKGDDAATAGARASKAPSAPAEAPGAAPRVEGAAASRGTGPAAEAGADQVLVKKHVPGTEHDIAVTGDGIRVCSPPPCSLIRKKYARELRENPRLAEQLDNAERMRHYDPHGAEQEAEEVFKALERIREEAGATAGKKVYPYLRDLDQLVPEARASKEARKELGEAVQDRMPAGTNVKVVKTERTGAGLAQGKAAARDPSLPNPDIEYQIDLPDAVRKKADLPARDPAKPGQGTFKPDDIRFYGEKGDQYLFLDHKEVEGAWGSSFYGSQDGRTRLAEMLQRHLRIVEAMGPKCRGFGYTTNNDELAKVLAEEIGTLGPSARGRLFPPGHLP